MSETATPICDLIESLLSRGLSPEMSLESARIAEAAVSTSRGPSIGNRERERLKKARYRARKKGIVPGDVPGTVPLDPISSKTLSVIKKDSKKVNKKSLGVPHVPGDNDDGWPDDHLEIFWREFPPYRRQAKAKVGAKLARIRSEGKVSWATLMNGVTKFAATQPGEFAPAPMVWLNDGRWDRVYGNGGSNATNRNGEKLGFSALAARVSGGGFPEVERPSPADLQPINRR